MPKREDETYKSIYYGGHPPACTCGECTDRRLRQLKKEVHPSYVSICPRCGKEALWHNVKEHKYECLNLKCKAVGSSPDKIAKESERFVAHVDSKGNSMGKETARHNVKRIAHYRIPNWLIALLLIFAFSGSGFGISIFIGSFIPFWIMLGFSLVYSVEKWLHYTTRKYKYIGKLYRLFLNLSMLCLLGLIIWSGIKLFSQQYFSSPFVGSLVFLAELVFFIWVWRTVSKNSWRWPSMKLTVFLLVCIAVVFTFAGVPPLSSYKDTLITKWEDHQTEQAAQQAEIEAKEAAEHQRREAEQEAKEAARVEAARQEQLKVEQARKEAEEEAARLASLRDPSWEELKAFLLRDDTDKMEYVFPTTVCEDFAKKLQKNAKEAGWRCAFVSVQLDGYPDWANLGIPSYTGHACNAFETTDRGLIYIDCTSTIGPHPLHQDAIVDVKIGNNYIPKLIFPSQGWSPSLRSMGKIVRINTVRW